MNSGFQQPPGTRKAAIPLTRDQRKIVLPVLGWIKKHAPTNHRTVALDYCCLHAADLIAHPDWPRIVIPTVGPTKPFLYYPHPDQDEIINMTLDLAKKAIGLDDGGASLAFACSTFILTWHEMAGSHNRKVRAIHAVTRERHLNAKAEQAGGTT